MTNHNLKLTESALSNLGRVAEAKQDYPTQDDAEFMADWFNGVNDLFGMSGTVTNVGLLKAWNASEMKRREIHGEIFGDKSPWSIKRSGRNAKVVWDKDKAVRLGVQK